MSRLNAPSPQHLLLRSLSLSLVLSLWPLAALALKTDPQQPINVTAGQGEAAMREGRASFGGGVQIDQGSMSARSATADVQKGADGSISSVLLKGSPATLSQQMDDGQQLHAQALSIRYDVAAGLVVLEGEAKVRRGEFDRFEGARIEYEPATTLVRANGQGAGPVTFTFKPSPAKPADDKPAPAPAPEQPAPEQQR